MKPTPPLSRSLRRLALTTKQVNGGYYKGTGSGSMGRHTKHGGYIIDPKKVRTYVVPADLKDFKVGFLSIPPVRTQKSSFGKDGCHPAIVFTDLGKAGWRHEAKNPHLQLTPFVTKNMEPLKGGFQGDPKGGLSGERYLDKWKRENGMD